MPFRRILDELLLHGNLNRQGRRITKETIYKILVDIFIASAGIDPACNNDPGARFLSQEATEAIVEAEDRASKEITRAEKRSKHQLRRTLSLRKSIAYCFADQKAVSKEASRRHAQLANRVSRDV